MTFHLPGKLFSVIGLERRHAVLLVLVEAGLHAGDAEGFELVAYGFHDWVPLR